MNRTVQRAMQMLNYIGNNPQGVTLQNIADEFDIPKSSAFVIIQTLLDSNHIATNSDNDKKYHIGVETFSLGMKYATSMDLTKETISLLNPIAEKYGKTGFVGILDGTSIVYLQKYKSSNAMLASCELGSRKPAHATALGKAILAHLPQDELEALLNQINYEKITEYTITSREQLLKELDEIRKKGYSLDVRENNDHLVCCAAPVFDYTRKVIAAISLSDIYNEEDDIEQQSVELKNVALDVSNRLGYH